MNMNKWIIHRLPILDDGMVYNCHGDIVEPETIRQGEAWMLIPHPDPYEEPKRWHVHYCYHELKWCLQDVQAKHKTYFPTMTTNDSDSAVKMQRLANAYQEVLP